MNRKPGPSLREKKKNQCKKVVDTQEDTCGNYGNGARGELWEAGEERNGRGGDEFSEKRRDSPVLVATLIILFSPLTKVR